MELMVVIDRVLQILIAAEKNVFNYQVVGFLAPHLVLLIQSLDLFSYGFKRNEKHIRCFRCSFFFPRRILIYILLTNHAHVYFRKSSKDKNRELPLVSLWYSTACFNLISWPVLKRASHEEKKRNLPPRPGPFHRQKWTGIDCNPWINTEHMQLQKSHYSDRINCETRAPA